MELSKSSSMLYNYLRPFNGKNDWTRTFTNDPTNTCNLALKVIGITLAFNTIAWTLATLIIFATEHYFNPVHIYLSLPTMYVTASMTAAFIMSLLVIGLGVVVVLVLGGGLMLCAIGLVAWPIVTAIMFVIRRIEARVPKALKPNKTNPKFCKPIDIVD